MPARQQTDTRVTSVAPYIQEIKIDSDAYATTIVTGFKVVAVAATAEPLAASANIWKIDIQALETNTSNIYVGDSSVAVTNGITLAPGESYTIDCLPDSPIDIADIYVDSAVNGEGITFNYFTKA